MKTVRLQTPYVNIAEVGTRLPSATQYASVLPELSLSHALAYADRAEALARILADSARQLRESVREVLNGEA